MSFTERHRNRADAREPGQARVLGRDGNEAMVCAADRRTPSDIEPERDRTEHSGIMGTDAVQLAAGHLRLAFHSPGTRRLRAWRPQSLFRGQRVQGAATGR
jgi:hypothetical protein